MTPDQLAIARALDNCSLQLGSGNKVFILNMGSLSEHDPERPLTPKQARWLYSLCHTYRRQLAPAVRAKAAELLGTLDVNPQEEVQMKPTGKRIAAAAQAALSFQLDETP